MKTIKVTKDIETKYREYETLFKAVKSSEAKLQAERDCNGIILGRITGLEETQMAVLSDTTDQLSYAKYKVNLRKAQDEKKISDEEIGKLSALVEDYQAQAEAVSGNIVRLMYQFFNGYVRERNESYYYREEARLKAEAIADIEAMKNTAEKYGVKFFCNSESLVPGRWRGEELFGTKETPAVKAEPEVFELPKTLQAKIKGIISPKAETVTA